MKNVLIIGAGQIGTALAQLLQTANTTRWQQDLDELSVAELQRSNPDVVINAAGKTDLAWCDTHAAEAIRSNLAAPVELFDRLQRLEHVPRFIHLSSGCVWDGPYDNNGAAFTPDSPPTPAVLYSWTKAACDAMLLARGDRNVAIIRPRQVYSDLDHPRNMLCKLRRYPALIDTPNSISSITIIVRTIQYLLEAENWSGVWNVYDQGIVTPFEIGTMLAEAGLRTAPQKMDKTVLDTFHKPRRVDTVLYDARFESCISQTDAKRELQRAITSLKAKLVLPVGD